MTTYAIIVAGGKGTRMQAKINKILLTLAGKPIICHTVKIFRDSGIDNIIIVSAKEDMQEIKKLTDAIVVEGGKERQDSVYNGIKAIENPQDDDVIVIHNAVNPLVTIKTIKDTIAAAKEHGAAVAGFMVHDTVKEVDDGFVTKTLDRKKLWQVQTPQAIKYGMAKEAFEKAYKDNFHGTDDVSLVERLGKKVKVVECSKDNLKITTPNDLAFAGRLVGNARMGIGQDSHKFTDKEKALVLGGVTIPNEQGLEANSDGDVILHAIFNAVSQAIGKKSLGYYADSMCEKGIKDSREYLKVILNLMQNEGYKINNIGIMLEAKKPRLESYEERIKESIAAMCGIEKDDVGITVTSGEALTPFGKGEAMQVFSIVSVVRK